jgi:hypothetical protein
MAKKGSPHPFRGPEPTCGISDRVAGWVIRAWMYREHKKYFQSIPGQRHIKSSLSKLSAKRTVEFLKINRSKARQVTGLLTGHYDLRGHLFKLGIGSPICGRCRMETETASHIL